MILTDAGPLVAILDARDDDHELCVRALASLRGPMVTTCAAMTEAMHLLGARAGWRAQEGLLRLAVRGDLGVAEMDVPGLERCRELMGKYKSLPMDFADATLVALAERLKAKRVFTLDSDFGVYRVGRRGFEVVPRL